MAMPANERQLGDEDGTLPEDGVQKPTDQDRESAAFPSTRHPAAEPSPETRPPGPEELPPPARFRILRPHARGGLGQVSVALDAELAREVALKEIQDRFADDPASRTRFLLEAEITGALEHPGIVPVYSLGAAVDGRPYYAMRFIRGQSLQEAIKRFHALPDGPTGAKHVELAKLLRRFLDVCNAIAYAHNRGVLHRDLKPGNVMLGEFGETLVVDWGLAKVLKGQPEDAARQATVIPGPVLQPRSADDAAPTQMGAALGTPEFMSPEQAEGRLDLLGPASDVYSLGATLYVLLTGQAAFRGPTWEVLRKVQQGDFVPPLQVRREVPAALNAICVKAMARQPEQRYRSARALADDLERWLADEPTTAYRETRRQRFARWARRHRTAVTSLSVGLLLCLAAGVGGLWLWNAAEHRRELQQAEFRGGLQTAAEKDEQLALVQLQIGRLDAAEKILAQAVARLEAEPHFAELQHRLEARRERTRALMTFYEQTDLAYLFVMAENDWQARLAVEKALRALNVLADGTWWTRLPDDDLSAAQRDRLREDAFRQLLMFAVLQGKPGVVQFGSKEAAPAYRATLELLARARAYRPTATIELLELVCHLGLGELAKLKPPQHQPEGVVDHLILGMLHSWLGVMPNDPFSEVLVRYVGLLGLNFLDLKTPLQTGEQHLRRAVRLDPQNYWSHLILAGTLEGRDPAAAELSFNACLGLQPNNVAVFLTRADVRMRQQANGQLPPVRQRELLDRALEDLNEAARRAPNNSLVYTYRCDCHRVRRDNRAALSDAEMAVRLAPESALPWRKRAETHLVRQEFAAAIADATTALRLDPLHAESLVFRARARISSGDHAGARADLDQAIRLTPWDGVCYLHRATTQLLLRSYQAGIDDCSQAIKLGVAAFDVYMLRGRAYRELGQLRQAVADYDRAIGILPARANGYVERAETWLRLGETERALKDFDEVVRLIPNALDIYVKRAEIRLARGEIDKGLQDCDVALRREENYAQAWYVRALLLTRRGDATQALAALDRAVTLSPHTGQYRRERGIARTTRGEWQHARADFEKAAELDATDLIAEYASALVCLRQGDRGAFDGKVRAALERCAQAWTELRYTWTVRMGWVSRHSAEVCQRLLTLAEHRLAGRRENAAARAVVAVFRFRVGRVAEAVQGLEGSLEKRDGLDPLRWLYLALASHRLGQAEKARDWLRKATDFMDGRPTAPEQTRSFQALHWNERLELDLLRREAEETLNGK